MLVQYLVGLCCLRWSADVVEVKLGDLVYDRAAKKTRDVDVTVSVDAGKEGRFAFMAYEVKREAGPLDVASVEQLAAKLKDMKAVTHRAVVSSSGFTEAARAKAKRHRLTLYEIQPWTRPLEKQFPALRMKGTIEECFPMIKYLLCWPQHKFAIFARSAPGPFNVLDTDPLFSAKKKPHKKFRTLLDLKSELLLRSTELLFSLEPAQTVLNTFPIPAVLPGGQPPAGPAWPHTHTLDIASDEVYVLSESAFFRLDQITICGWLQWQRSQERTLYYVMQNSSSHEAFAGALVSRDIRDGQMTALVFSPRSREIGIHFVRLSEKHLNLIRDLSLKRPGGDA
ncbi:MAG: restriction endonuclease [Planctomycetaceae bacterium]|nr:restriction endonuclease [Planctomycetaceae bacterium]